MATYTDTDTNYFKRGFGNYVIASGNCLVNFATPHLGKLYDADHLKDCLKNNVYRLLFSFGYGMHKGFNRLSANRIKRIGDEIDKMRNCPFTNDSPIYVDSGGYQVNNGYLASSQIPQYLDLYTEFLQRKIKDFTMAFSLDLPASKPGIFNTYAEMESYNRLCYKRFAEFPQDMKDRIFYIHHYSSPSKYRIWRKFIEEDGYIDGFTNFSSPPENALKSALSYSIPLSDIVSWCKSKKITRFNFHALGGAGAIDTFLYVLMSKHIKAVHGIDVNLTYDSSTLFKGVAVGRNLRLFKEDGILYTADIHSDQLHLKFDKGKTLEDCIFEAIGRISENYGLETLDRTSHPVFKADGKADMATYVYMILHEMHVYRRIELECMENVDGIYQLYADGSHGCFIDACMEFLRRFASGKITRKITDYCSSLIKAFKVVEQCDPVYNMGILQNASSANDIPEMSGHQPLIF